MNLPTLVILIGGGILVLSIIKDNKDKLLSFFSKAKTELNSGITSISNTTAPAGADILVDNVKSFVELKSKLKAAGNDGAVKQLDAVFPLLNKDKI